MKNLHSDIDKNNEIILSVLLRFLWHESFLTGRMQGPEELLPKASRSFHIPPILSQICLVFLQAMHLARQSTLKTTCRPHSRWLPEPC